MSRTHSGEAIGFVVKQTRGVYVMGLYWKLFFVKIVREAQTQRGVLLAASSLLLGILVSLLRAVGWFIEVCQGSPGAPYEMFSWVIIILLLIFPYAFIYSYLSSEVRTIPDKEIRDKEV